MSEKKRKIIVSVTNDLTYDQRVGKVCMSLKQQGYEICLVGRLLKDSAQIDRPYSVKRFKLLFNQGFLFYAFFNLRLFIFLLFSKGDIYHANDLDTLLANWLASKIKKKKLVYDTHEYFTGVPEIQDRPSVKKVWEAIEKKIFPTLKHVFTVNSSIAALYEKKYNIAVKVLRNLPLNEIIEKTETRETLNLPRNKNIVILQGAGINIDRGAEELLEAIAMSENLFLCIVGSGDVIHNLKSRASKKDLQNKVLFTGKLEYVQMMQFTMNADVGVSLDKDTNINYRYSLPNKIFDYLKAGIPIVCSDLKEVSSIIQQFNIGTIVSSHDPNIILKAINKTISKNKADKFSKSLKSAIEKLNWENEVDRLIDEYSKIE